MEMPLRDLNRHDMDRVGCVNWRLKEAECDRKANLGVISIEEINGMNKIMKDRVEKMNGEEDT